MRRRSHVLAESSPVARLWALRILVELKRGEFTLHSFGQQGLLRDLGLGELSEDGDYKLGLKNIVVRLRELHQQAEQDSNKANVPKVLADNVAHLAVHAGLNDTDCRLLEFAVLMHGDPMLHEAAESLENLSTTKAHKALATILGLPEPDIRASLGRDGMLAHSGLLTLDHNLCDLTGKLDPISSEFSTHAMLPDMQPADLLRGVVSPASPAELALDDYPHLAPSLDILIPYLRHAHETGRKGVNVFLYGPPGTGKTQLAKVLATHLGCDLFEVASEDKDGDVQNGGHKRLNALRAAQCFFGKGRSLILFDEVEDVFTGSIFCPSTAQENKGWMNRMLESNGAPTLWLSNSIDGLDPAFVRRFDMIVEVPVPPRGQRERSNRAICGDVVDDSTLARISDCEMLAPAVVARAANVVRAIGEHMDRQQSSAAAERLIDNILEAQGHPRLHANEANRLPCTYDPAFINADADLVGIAGGLAASRSGRLCLYGPPGTGKTAYGRWLAQQLGMPLLVKRASDLLSMWVGQAEKNIAGAFRSAERDGAILLIDEVDSFLQDRHGAQRSWEVTQVNEMLTQMEAFPGIFIASTNLMQGLDQAALRRFDLKLKFDYLKPNQAIAMLQRHCETLGLPAPNAAGELLARQRLRHLTPGDFAAVMRRHRFRPIASNGELVAALQAECAIKADSRPVMGFVH
jgi:SpoVK/Ycf46/Vps4 family AAA+-type ATPase